MDELPSYCLSLIVAEGDAVASYSIGTIVIKLLSVLVLVAGIAVLGEAVSAAQIGGVLLVAAGVLLVRGLGARGDAGDLAFALAISFFSILLFGLIPALQSSRVDVNDVLKEGGRGGSGTRRRGRSALLVAEVSDTSLRHDRMVKTSLYARAGIAEYWIVNLKEHTVEVNRNPAELDEEQARYGYKLTLRLTIGDTISPLAAPSSQIAVADFLPPRR